MPAEKTLEVRVFESDEASKNPDKAMVLIVLPPKGKIGDLPQFDLEKTWLCTWSQWRPKLLSLRKH